MQKLELIGSGNANTDDYIAVVALDQPEQANALDKEFIVDMTKKVKSLHNDSHCRAMLIYGEGKHFCSGAHLKWMQESAQLDLDENINEAKLLIKLYESIDKAPFPTMAVVRGAAYGGGVGLAAACDCVIAAQNSEFCLSEVKLGLIPAVIMPYIKRRMQYGQLRRYTCNAAKIDAMQAVHIGLADIYVDLRNLHKVVTDELNQFLLGGPQAQHFVKEFINELHSENDQQSKKTAKVIATVRSGSEAKSGLAAFFAKQPSPWIASIKDPKALSEILGY